MWKTTLAGILARKLRLALTALAVLLGVAFVSGTYVLTDTLQASFDEIFAKTETGIDVVVRAQDPATGGNSERSRIPDAVLAMVRQVPGVATADGFLLDYAQLVDRSGHAVKSGFAPTWGVAWPSSGKGPLRLLPNSGSRPPRGPHQVAIDAATAHRHGFKVGDRVRILLRGPAEAFRIVGLFGFGDQFDLGGATFAAFDLPTAQRVFGVPGAVDGVNVTATRGISEPELRRRLSGAIGPAFDIAPAGKVAEQNARPVRQGIGFIRYALVGFAAVGLVVGSFIIFNTFTILAAQRTRELGLLRALGASGRQVLGSVIVEAAAVGALAAAAGLAAGIGLARLLLDLVARFGIDVPNARTVLLGRTVIAAIIVGLVVTVGSALYPAVRAARTSPIAAIDDVPRTTSAPLRRRAVVGTVVMVGGLVLLVVGLRIDAGELFRRLEVVGTGAFLAFFGVVILIATFVRPMARAVGWPLSRNGVTGRLARGNAMRNPRRTAATASALVVGLSLVSLVAIFSASIKASIQGGVKHGIRADFVLSAEQLAGFSPKVRDRVASLSAVEAVSGLRLGLIRVGDRTQTVIAVNPRTLTRVLDLDIRKGSVKGLLGGGILLPEDEARRYAVTPGGTVAITFPRTGTLSVTVAGVYAREQFTGGYPVPFGVMSTASQELNFPQTQQDTVVYVKARPGRVGEARREIEGTLGRDFPNIQVQSRKQFQGKQEGAVDQFVGVLVSLLILSEIIAVLGIINTLLLSVYERTRELGLLRVVGMSRRQVSNMVRGESIIIAVIGGLIGLMVGIFWGWAFTTALRQEGITAFRVPPLQVAGFMVFSVIAGVIAALLPAWRATRLDVLEAIAEE